MWIAPRTPTLFEVGTLVQRETDLLSIVGHRGLHHHNASVDALDQESVVVKEGRDILETGNWLSSHGS